jgi:hypothetical protein
MGARAGPCACAAQLQLEAAAATNTTTAAGIKGLLPRHVSASTPHRERRPAHGVRARAGRRPAQVEVLNPVRMDVNAPLKLLLCFFDVFANSPMHVLAIRRFEKNGNHDI